MMKKMTVQQFQSDFDNLINRVEEGKSFIISSEFGDAVIAPYDDLIEIHTNHNDGC